MKYQINNQKGVTVLIYMTILATLILLIISSITPRLLLSTKRATSLSDATITSYAAESQINNFLSQLLIEGSTLNEVSNQSPDRFGDTSISTKTKEEAGVQTITVTATRPYAVQRLQAVRNITAQSQKADILLTMDCTASGGVTTDETTTPLLEQKLSAIYFLETIRIANFANRVNIGINSYGLETKWLTRNGVELTPKSNLPISDYISSIHENYGYTAEGSPGCAGITPVSNIGGAIKTADEYYTRNNTPGTKKIHILITDAVPNARDFDSTCLPANPNDDRCVGEDRCYTLARDYLACKLTQRNTSLYDLYTIVVNRNPLPDEVAQFTETTGVLRGTSTKYYQTTNPDDPGELVRVFADIFEGVSQILSTTKLYKIVPTEN